MYIYRKQWLTLLYTFEGAGYSTHSIPNTISACSATEPSLQEFLLTFKFFISILFWCIDIHVVYVCIGMNVCTCVGACTCMCESHRPMVVGIFLYDSLAYFFEIGSLIQPGTH